MVRITIEIETDGTTATTSLVEARGGATESSEPSAMAGVMKTPAIMGAASGAQNAGAAPMGLDAPVEGMAQPMGRDAAEEGPVAFVGGLSDSGSGLRTPTDVDAGSAPDTDLEPAPFIMTEENGL